MKKNTPKAKSPSAKETLVAFILDKSGSMGTVRQATISGFNEYVGTLRKDKKSKYAMSFTLFDTNVEKRHVSEPLSSVEDLTEATYRPDGMTALYDAAMQTISETEKVAKKGQPVLCVIMTDGEENSSKEYTEKELKAKIGELEKKNWTFVFLGANQDAWAVGQKFGMSHTNVANYHSTDVGTRGAFAKVAANTMMYAQSASMGGGGGASFFTKEDQDALDSTK